MATGRTEHITYRGRVYYRHPDSHRRSDRVYYRLPQGGGYLHRAVYEDHHGPIPPGHDVHHIDRDPSNNDPSNLTAKPAANHARDHSNQRFTDDDYRRQNAELLNEVRHLATEWHRSDEGRAWHRQHAVDTWKERESETRVCDHCGAEYQTRDRRSTTRFCSNRCKSAARRASGVDDVTRTCGWCGAAFRVNKYDKTRGCSRSCGRKLAAYERRTGLHHDR